MIKEWSVSPQEGQLTQCVRRFGVPKEDPSEVKTREGKGFVRFSYLTLILFAENKLMREVH